MHMIGRAAACVALVAVGAAGAARADDVGPLTTEQTASLDRALWLLTAARAGDVTVTPEGDHYRVLGNLPQSPTVAREGGNLTANARPLDGGAWQFDDVALTSPIVFTQPIDDTRAELRIALTGQAGHARIDPTLATGSESERTVAALAGSASIPDKLSVDVAATGLAARSALTSARDGRVDQHVHTEAHDLRLVSHSEDAKEGVAIGIAGLTVEGDARAVSLDVLDKLFATLREDGQTLRHLSQAAPSPGGDAGEVKPPLTDEQRRVMRELLSLLRDLGSGVSVTVNLDDLTVSAGKQIVGLQRAQFGESVGAVDGKADVKLRLELAGLAAPLVPASLRDYVPRRVVFAPHLTGLDAAQAWSLLDDAIADPHPAQEALAAKALGLLARGPVALSIDELSLDVGPAALHATGEVAVAGATLADIVGSATIESTGMGALIKQAGTNPVLKQAAPVLIFLRGIGEQAPDDVVRWKVAYANGQATVNGTDLSQLMH